MKCFEFGTRIKRNSNIFFRCSIFGRIFLDNVAPKKYGGNENKSVKFPNNLGEISARIGAKIANI